MIYNPNNKLGETLTRDGEHDAAVNVRGPNFDAFRRRMLTLVDHVGSIAAIARKCDIPGSTVKKWVDGVSDPSRERCVSLAAGTGVSLLWIVSGEGPMLVAGDGVSDAAAPSYGAAAAQAPDADRLAEAIALIDQGMARTRRNPSPATRARLVVLAYDALERGDQNGALRAFVEALIELSEAPSNEP